ATPLDDEARDWADFAAVLAPDAVVIVVPDRLGAINQARLAFARAAALGLPAGVWLNGFFSAGPSVAASNRAELAAAGVPLWSEASQLVERVDPNALCQPASESALGSTRSTSFSARLQRDLAARDTAGLRRELRVTTPADGILNLADNDYLSLAHDPALAAAVAAVARTHGTSSAASPLVTGWQSPHAALTAELGAWHGLPH